MRKGHLHPSKRKDSTGTTTTTRFHNNTPSKTVCATYKKTRLVMLQGGKADQLLKSSRFADRSRSYFLTKFSLRLLTSGGSCKYSLAFSRLPGPVIPRPLFRAELRPRSQSNPRKSSWSIIIGTMSVNRLNATKDTVSDLPRIEDEAGANLGNKLLR